MISPRGKRATQPGTVKTAGGNLFAPGTASALAFKHADCPAGERVEYAADEIELGITLHASAIFPGLFACEFFAAEEVHFLAPD